MAEGEQAGVRVVADSVKAKLVQENQAYREKFGYIFIVCATGNPRKRCLHFSNNAYKMTPRTS